MTNPAFFSTMRRAQRPLAALTLVVVLGLTAAGCGDSSAGSASGGQPTTSASTPADSGTETTKAGSTKAPTTARGEAVKFAECMRAEGVSDFPDPDPSGELTVDAVANGSSIDTSSPAWTQALEACRDLQPAGFTGTGRTPAQQQAAVAFAQCVRDEGIKDFPDPGPDDALIDTTRIPSMADRDPREVPGFQQALDTCGAQWGAKAGVTGP